MIDQGFQVRDGVVTFNEPPAVGPVTVPPAGPGRMLQPPKSEIRRAFNRACDFIEKQQKTIADLRAKVVEHERWMFAIYGVGVLTGIVVGWATA